MRPTVGQAIGYTRALLNQDGDEIHVTEVRPCDDDAQEVFFEIFGQDHSFSCVVWFENGKLYGEW